MPMNHEPIWGERRNHRVFSEVEEPISKLGRIRFSESSSTIRLSLEPKSTKARWAKKRVVFSAFRIPKSEF